MPIDTPLAEPAVTRRSSRSSVAPAAAPVPLTRAELRRRAQEQGFGRRDSGSSKTEAAASGDRIRTAPQVAETAVVVETTASTGEPTPMALPTAAITIPTRRRRRAAGASAPEGAATGKAGADDAYSAAEEIEEDRDEQVDEFEAAARLFSFTAETPVQVAAAASPSSPADSGPSAGACVDQPARRLRLTRVAAASFSVGVIGVIGLLTVGMTTPVAAVAAAQGKTAATADLRTTQSSSGDDSEIQAYVAPANVQHETVQRSDQFDTTTLAEIAADSGISNFSSFFTNDPTAAIQWPFTVGVPMTYGFGMRSGSMHEGVDFVPGEGAPIQAIADGTVRIATESGGAYGVTVVIDHVIDGELVSSRYAHMQYDSLRVAPGQRVTVGTVLGKTGNTGRSFGAHLHFEILAGGTTAVDPLTWLRSHTEG